ncbi:MAG: GHKL domain-containing protein [Methylococcaceae bacterium]|nr:GHKL domain-containing protein [Methylococcaceae bacterium]
MSLTTRINLSAALVLLSFICLTAFALERAFFDSTESALRDTMSSQLFALMAAAEVDNQQVIMPSNELDALLDLPASGIYATISNSAGYILWQSSSTISIALPSPPLLTQGEKTFNKVYVDDKGFYRTAYTVLWPTPTDSIELTFSVITDLRSFNKQINRYRTTLWGWLSTMAMLLLCSQAIILRWGLSPLRKVGAELNRIETGQQQKIEAHYPQEIERLTDNINLLLEQERQQKIRYRDAMGNLAHSLKTPLAVLQVSLEADTQQQNKLTMQEQLDRMDAIVKYQLQWAVTTRDTHLGTSVNLLSTINRLLSSLQKVYADRAITVQVTVDSSLNFRGDEGDLMEVLGNLLENAFKWAHQQIAIKAEQTHNQLIIIIDDDGVGIASDKVERLLQRGVRADQTTAGHGIGLSIVKNIVQAYGGELRIEKSHLAGAKVIISF